MGSWVIWYSAGFVSGIIASFALLAWRIDQTTSGRDE